ncbi:MAG: rhomboid family intramembrane serine protease [Bacteroidetes bacterium]|nr:rhomboid family intramembrane serine protease [Bacteroidota bacterium]
MNSIIDEVKDSFRQGSVLTKFIYLNIGVFLAVKIVQIFLYLFNSPDNTMNFLKWLAVSADFSELIRKPWTVITYMFLHENFIHILFNLLWFYWFGKIFLEYFEQKKLAGVYILGGLAGAVLYILAFNIFPAFGSILHNSLALGASASVMAIVIAVSFYVPDHTVHMMFFGQVKIKYLAIGVFLLTSVFDFSTNTGGKIAHIGGALLGYLFTYQFRKGKDITRGINRLMDSIVSFFKPGQKMKVTYKRPKTDMEFNRQKAEKQNEVDGILDKISKGGYESLTKKEKEILFKMGKGK